ncbi:rhoptry protein [Reticulomyxa filosa]|uniref:Rhoptry protein n=1 Tax=Reticulomyxa filosa TaxID=46433 RepID=X6P3C0_RETFI|nr:rhoptry protein [Reticulomyxa filosa]|eukprot:ETO32579.1 rhoptry protein [Reticulomyxa filosa]
MNNIITTMRNEFWSDLERSIRAEKEQNRANGFDQFMLIPCFNLLASRNRTQANEDLLKRFDFKNVKKDPNLAARCIDVIETDLKIRYLPNISPMLFAEIYVMQIVHSQNDDDLSEKVLEFLFSKKEFMTVETWVKLWTTPDLKYIDVICNLYKCHFEKWSQFVERLQTTGALKNERVRERLLDVFREKNFQDSVVQSNENFINFISFMLSKKDIIWQNWEHMLQILEHYIDKTDMIYNSSTLTAIFDVLWKHCSEIVKRMANAASERLLNRLTTEESSLALWLQLFKYELNEEKKESLKDSLSKSLYDWIDNKMVREDMDSTQQLVLLLLYPEFWSLLKEYKDLFLAKIKKQRKVILLSSKRWSEKTLKSMKELLEKEFIDMELLDEIFEVIVDVPVQVDSNVNNNAIEEKKENKDEKRKDDKQEMSKKEESKLRSLISHLDYCFLCMPWLPLIQYGATKVKKLEQLQDFMKITLNKLFAMVDDKSIAFYVCEFLEHDNNKNNIKVICTSLPGWGNSNIVQDKVNALSTILTEFKEFIHLKQLYTMVSTQFMDSEDISEQLQKFSHFFDNRDLESFPKASHTYQNEQNMFRKLKSKMQHLEQMNSGNAFKNIWIQYRKEMKEREKLTFEVSMDELYKNVNKKWRELEQVVRDKSLSREELRWLEGCDLHFELRLLFPNQTQQYIESMAKSINEYREKITQLEKMIEPWTELKKATDIVKKYHTSNKKIENDKSWNNFVTSLEDGRKALKNEKISIQVLSQHYDTCINYFGKETLECAELFYLIIKNEEKVIKELATSENFANKEHFANTMETLDNCKEGQFEELVNALRTVNGKIHEHIWDANIQKTSQVAKEILSIYKNNEHFTTKFKQCCDVDLNRISFLVEKAGRLQAVQSFNLLIKAIKDGQWHFVGCDQVLQVNSIVIDNSTEKEQREEWLVLHIDKEKLNCDQVEQAIDHVLLGFSKEKKLKEITKLIEKFGVCKDIQTLRVAFWRKGGRQVIEKLQLEVKEPLSEFKKLQSEWQKKLKEWRDECVKLRTEYPILNYFTFNEIHRLCEKLNDIVSCRQKHREILCSKFILPFLQRIDPSLSNVLPFVEKWRFEVVEKNKALTQFGTVFSDIWVNSKKHCDTQLHTSPMWT